MKVLAGFVFGFLTAAALVKLAVSYARMEGINKVEADYGSITWTYINQENTIIRKFSHEEYIEMTDKFSPAWPDSMQKVHGHTDEARPKVFLEWVHSIR